MAALWISVGVGVAVVVDSGVGLLVAVGSGVGAAVGVAVGPGAGVTIAVGSGVGVGVSIGAGTGVGVAVGIGVSVAVGSGFEAAVGPGGLVGVCAGTGVGSSVGPATGVGSAWPTAATVSVGAETVVGSTTDVGAGFTQAARVNRTVRIAGSSSFTMPGYLHSYRCPAAILLLGSAFLHLHQPVDLTILDLLSTHLSAGLCTRAAISGRMATSGGDVALSQPALLRPVRRCHPIHLSVRGGPCSGSRSCRCSA